MEREEAIEVIRKNWPDASFTQLRKALETLIPELRESEDERIRKFLVKHVSEWIGCIEHDLKLSSKDVESEEELAMFKACLAYLEKQKEKPKTADSIPPFCVSNVKWADTIITRAIVSLSDDVDYNRDEPCKYRREIDDLKKLRDVLCGQKEQKPFSQEVFDAAKHEALWGEQKPAEWSEEDEKVLSDCIEAVGSMSVRSDVKTLRDWLKSLPERFNLQLKPKVECDNETKIQKAYREGKNAGRKEVFDHPEYYGLQLRRMYDYETGKRNPEWSEEDEKMLGDIIRYLEVQKEDRDAPFFDLAISFLKSLRPSWKPNKKQMEALGNCVLGRTPDADARITLEILWDNLQKLL